MDPTTDTTDLAGRCAAAMRNAAAQAGLPAEGARVVHFFATVVYHLPAADAVARVSPSATDRMIEKLATSIRITNWLADQGFPTVRPLALDQPIITQGCVVTFWRHLPQHGPAPTTCDLGILLHGLHRHPEPPFDLPDYQPLRSIQEAVRTSVAINETERDWLTTHIRQLLEAYQRLDFLLGHGMIHGDPYRGNLLKDADRTVLIDWDNCSRGPREIDLIPTLQAAERFGLPAADRAAFIRSYGADITTWPGYRTLADMRAVSTLTALLRNAHADPDSMKELKLRITSLRTRDDRRWNSFTAKRPHHSLQGEGT